MHFFLPNLKAIVVQFPYSNHLISMRCQVDRQYPCTNLNGQSASVKILNINKKDKSIQVSFDNITNEPNLLTKTLIQAIPDKVYLDKLVEILPLAQVETCYLFFSDRSVIYTINWERLNNILIRSCELAMLNNIPKLILVNSKDLKTHLESHNPIVLECANMSTIDKPTMMEQINNHKRSILIGPEGGWSTQELEFFKLQNMDFGYLGSVILPSWLAGYTALQS